MTPRAYSYIRMSTAAQSHGTSQQRQLELSEAFATKHGLKLETGYQDIGVSAYSGRNLTHGALGKFMQAIQEGKIEKGSYLLLESHDRLTRTDPLSALELFIRLLKSGIRIVLLGQGREEIIGDTGNGDSFPYLVKAIVDFWRGHSESAHKEDRLAKTWMMKRAKIDEEKLTARCPGWLRLDDDRKNFSIVPERVEVVRRIYRWATAGMGEFTIVRKLNECKVRPFGKSASWQKSSVSRILTSRAVFGEFQPRISRKHGGGPAGPAIPNYFPPIVTEAEFDNVSAVRKRTRRLGGGRKGPRITNLFSKVARCGYCFGPMGYRNRGKKGGVSLVCDGGQRGVGCTRMGWNYQEFEKSFLTFCAADEVRAMFLPKESTSETGERLQEKRADLRTKTILRERMWTAFESSEGASGFVRDKFDQLDSEITSLEAEVAALAALFAEESAASNAQRASLAELPAWVDALQSAKSEDTYRIRSALQELFRATISSLSVCVEGGEAASRPKSILTDDEKESMDEEMRWYCKERISELVAFGHTEDEAHAYIELAKLSNPERYRYFNVRFNDGSGIRVTPHPTEATEFLRLIDSGKEHNVISFIDAAEAKNYATASRTLSKSTSWSGDNTEGALKTP